MIQHALQELHTLVTFGDRFVNAVEPDGGAQGRLGLKERTSYQA